MHANAQFSLTLTSTIFFFLEMFIALCVYFIVTKGSNISPVYLICLVLSLSRKYTFRVHSIARIIIHLDGSFFFCWRRCGRYRDFMRDMRYARVFDRVCNFIYRASVLDLSFYNNTIGITYRKFDATICTSTLFFFTTCSNYMEIFEVLSRLSSTRLRSR